MSFWDTSLHLPLWVPQTEKAAIESRMPHWIEQFESCGADISSLVHYLKKPLRPLWISQNTLIWLNEVPPYQSWDFTPVILVSASGRDGLIKQSVQAEFSWRYIPGAGDDEESWARCLTPDKFWKNAFSIVDAGPEACNRIVSEIVEKDRVYRSQRGECLPQVKVDASKSMPPKKSYIQLNDFSGVNVNNETNLADVKGIFWIGSTRIAVGSILDGMLMFNMIFHKHALVNNCCEVFSLIFSFSFTVLDESVGFDCVLNCDASTRISVSVSSDAFLCLPIVV
jgi:tRNA A64-2'-O-ribosylphosphate transferase